MPCGGLLRGNMYPMNLSSTTAPPVYADARPGECARSLLDNRKAKEAFSWEPTTDLDAGLHAVWEHLHQTDPHMR